MDTIIDSSTSPHQPISQKPRHLPSPTASQQYKTPSQARHSPLYDVRRSDMHDKARRRCLVVLRCATLFLGLWCGSLCVSSVDHVVSIESEEKRRKESGERSTSRYQVMIRQWNPGPITDLTSCCCAFGLRWCRRRSDEC